MAVVDARSDYDEDITLLWHNGIWTQTQYVQWHKSIQAQT